MLDVNGCRELAVLTEGRRFSVVRAERGDGTNVLLKTVVAEFADSRARDELHEEYELERSLSHPNLVEAIDFLAAGARPVLVLADDGGETLRSLLDRSLLSVRRALEVAIGIGSGLAELHRHDVVHRDLTPAGVTVGDGAAVRIIDLSLATRMPRQQAALMAPSVVSGSLPYISPEQTGRTSRPVDYRTDLYSLGIVLFEMLVGELPFVSNDPLELFHDHLAVRPPHASDRRPEVPRILGDLVALLLEKDPVDRYRSALGAVRDLEAIHDRLVRGLDPSDLGLSGTEISTRFQLPDQLFGREDDVAEMETWFERAARGRTSLVLVHGYSGVGKTSLIEELRTSVNRRRGYQATGKFDQLDRGSAYLAVTSAFRDLVRQLLTGDDASVDAWRDELREVLGDNAGALAEVVPNLHALLGDLPHPERLEATNERNRFNRLVSLFLSAVASPDRPLVIVLDDLQWADSATLDFMERTAVDGRHDALLVVGAYRDNEIDETHPLHLLRQRLAAEGVEIGDLALEPLSDRAMAQLVSTALGRTVEDAAPLTQLCVRRTGSNPFFVRLFLSSIFEDGLLQLDPSSGAWSWDIEQVAARQLTENMVELTTDKVAGTSTKAQDLLGVMALVGTEADAALLEEVSEGDPIPTLHELGAQDLVTLTESAGTVHWQFSHDRIQEAASARLDDATRLHYHRMLGDALHRRLDSRETQTSVFSVLRHRNEVARSEGGSNADLAAMNLDGGQAAMRATAYDSALAYFSMGVSLLGSEPWATDNQTAFSLHLGAADAARLATDFEEMERWLDIMDRSASDSDDRVQAALLRILYLSHSGDNVQAVDVARTALADLGWRLPVKPRLPQVIGGLLRTRAMLRKYSIDDLRGLPVMENERARSTMKILNEAVSAAYWADPNVMALMIQKAMQLTVRHGNDPSSALFYTAYGMVISGIVGDPEAGIAYANLGVELAEEFGTEAKPSRVRFTRDSLVAPATVPLRETESSLELAYRAGTEIGDMGFGTGAFLFLGFHRLLSGVPLDSLVPDLDAAETLLRRHAQLRNLAAALALRQFVHDVRHGPTKSVPFNGPYVDADADVDTADRMATCWTYTFRAMSRYHLGDAAGAYDDIATAAPYLDAVLGQALAPVNHLYGVLAAAAVRRVVPNAARSAQKHRKRLARFARHNPIMQDAALALADGALAAADGKSDEAARLLDSAAQLASERAEPRIAALASSLHADVADEAGDVESARQHRAWAAEAYRNWGATALVDTDASTPSTSAGATRTSDLDLETVVRASEAISGQIELEALLRSLMEVMLQNAGADRGVLFRVDADQVVAEAEGRLADTTSDVVVFVLSPGDQPDVAKSVVRLVARTSEPIITARAVDDPALASDESIQARGIRSLLCLPLVYQGRLQGILYLENNQVDGAFTEARFRLLRVLSSQAASALEKARLHDAQARLIEAQHKFVPAQFLQTLGRPNLTDLTLGEGTIREVDILFTDIRGFTSIVERLTPDEAMEFLNSYLAHMEPVVHQHGGFIDTYDGDAILALFDAGGEAAVRSAIAMAAAEREDNERRVRRGQPPVHTGFGINTDAVMMGIVGGETSLRATIIGDAVNLASRVQDLTKRYTTRMLIAEKTAARVTPDSSLTLRPLERVQVVGKTQATLVFEVLDALDPADRERRLTNLAGYREAHAAYESGDLGGARSGFAAIVNTDPDDAPAAVMLRRTEQLLSTGAAPNDPPVTRLETK